MAYSLDVDPPLKVKLKKLAKSDRILHSRLLKKVYDIINNPYQDTPYEGKMLGNVMKGNYGVHIGHFVLVYQIDHEKKLVILKDFDHHDKIYSH